jgi:hypothetical protein
MRRKIGERREQKRTQENKSEEEDTRSGLHEERPPYAESIAAGGGSIQ